MDNVRRSFIRAVAVLSRSGGATNRQFPKGAAFARASPSASAATIVGTNFTGLIELLEDDPSTDAVVIYGEPGGSAGTTGRRLKQTQSPAD